MSPPPKGKQGTKGAKQIVEENKGTLNFYRNMAIGSSVGSLLVNIIVFDITKVTVVMGIISMAALVAAYQFMSFMTRAKYSETGALIDAGNDLNMEGGIAENVKDLIILTSATLLLVLFSNYFWLLLLLAPIRVIWLLWGSVIQLWLAQRHSNENSEVDGKKQRKLERKMRRMR